MNQSPIPGPATTTRLPFPTPTLHGKGPVRDNVDSGTVAGAVVAVLIIMLLITVTLTILIIVFVKRRNKSRLSNGTRWYVKTSPGVCRPKVLSHTAAQKLPSIEESTKSMTPDFLVVRHKNGKSTVPNSGLFSYTGNTVMQPNSTQRWSERSSGLGLTTHGDTTPTLSTGDVTLPRHIRSSSVETNSTRPYEGSLTPVSSISRQEKCLKVYQMPSFEDDNIIVANDGEEKEKETELFRNTL